MMWILGLIIMYTYGQLNGSLQFYLEPLVVCKIRVINASFYLYRFLWVTLYMNTLLHKINTGRKSRREKSTRKKLTRIP